MFSVIVPFYNAEAWLERCLESLHINKGVFEFILVDDHSTDGSRDIAYDYCHKDMRFTLLTNQHEKGVSGARNTGIDYASGDWITFIDADDEMQPNMYRLYVYAGAQDAEIIQFNHMRCRNFRCSLSGVTEGEFTCEKLPPYWCMVWNKLYSKELLENIRFKEGLQYGEDELFNLECLAKSNRIIHLREANMIHHFDNKGSLSKIKDEEGLIAQVRALEEFLLRQPDPKIRKAVCLLLSEHWQSPTYIKRVAHA